jgi:hypothetical protein
LYKKEGARRVPEGCGVDTGGDWSCLTNRASHVLALWYAESDHGEIMIHDASKQGSEGEIPCGDCVEVGGFSDGSSNIIGVVTAGTCVLATLIIVGKTGGRGSDSICVIHSCWGVSDMDVME